MKLNTLTTPLLLSLTSTPISTLASPNPNIIEPRSNPTTLPTTSSSSISTILPSSHPRNHNIAVGLNTTTFTPSTLKSIPIGDTLIFYFYPTNYSVIQSSFQLPCQPLPLSPESGLFSGWHPTGSEGGIARSKFIVTVMNTEPLWIYGVDGNLLAAVGTGGDAGQTPCEMGMAMVVNPRPKAQANGVTLGVYKKKAAVLVNGTVDNGGDKAREKLVMALWSVPDGIWGGEVSGVSDKEKVRWEERHPVPGVGNGTVTGAVRGNGTVGAAGFKNGGRKGVGSGWVGIGVVLVSGLLVLGV